MMRFQRFHLSIVLLFPVLILWTNIANGQNNPGELNRNLIDSVEKMFTRGCINSHVKKISKKEYKKDVEGIILLNKIYELQIDTSLITEIPNIGFYLSSRVMQTKTDEIFLFAKNVGNLRVMVEIILNKATGDIERKMIIATNTKFFCETATSSTWSILDFVYIKKVIGKVGFPLQLSRYCSTLESKYNR